MSDYERADVLLPFLERFMAERSPFTAAKVMLRPDGALTVELERAGGDQVEVCWIETNAGAAVSIPASTGVVEGAAGSGQAARHVASRLHLLLRGKVPGLLEWRNRKPLRLSWSAHLFELVRPGLLAVGRTRWFDYALTRVDDDEGLISLEFKSSEARVLLRLTLTKLLGEVIPIHTWDPVALIIAEDDRGDKLRNLREHRVEDFTAYLLSRNLPPRFTLAFERGCAPAGYQPPDWNIDFLETEPQNFNLFFDVSAPGNAGLVAKPWDRLLDEITPDESDSAPDSAAFIGFGSEHLREVVPVLARRGVFNAGAVFPQLDQEALRGLGQAGLLVLNEWDYVATVFSGFLDRVQRPRISLPLPYGFQTAVDFVDRITRRLGISGRVLDDPEIAGLRERFDVVRARLRGRVLTLVGRTTEVADSMSPARHFGIPLADGLRELGLTLDILLFLDPNEVEDLDESELIVALGLDTYTADKIRFFSHSSQLNDQLSEGAGEAVYTEIHNDQRVTDAGRTPLTPRAFEPGFRGAIRTAENIESILDSGFLRDRL